MGQKIGRKKLIAVLAVVGLLVLVVALVAVAKSKTSTNPPVSTETSNEKTPEISQEGETTDTPMDTQPADALTEPSIDPATLATVSIEPASLSVSYLKGVGGFDFKVLRTSNGTKYVEFSSTKLAGTKCTNDEGQFASIIESPSVDESTTLAKTTIVDERRMVCLLPTQFVQTTTTC
jgi:cytoskeletal protein RodZ